MKHSSSTSLLLSALVLLCGCGGGYSSPPSAPASSPPLVPQAQGPNIAGNWQFTTTSMVGMAPATIAGSLVQSASTVSGAVHVDGSSCFDRLATVVLTGTRTGSDISLTSAPVLPRDLAAAANGVIPDQQVAAFTGSVTDQSFTGTYTIDGGCADDRGNVTGIKVPPLAGRLSGTFTTSGEIHSTYQAM